MQLTCPLINTNNPWTTAENFGDQEIPVGYEFDQFPADSPTERPSDNPPRSHGGDTARVTFKNTSRNEVKVSWVEEKGMKRVVIKPHSPEIYAFLAGKSYNMFFQVNGKHPYAERWDIWIPFIYRK